MEVTSQIFINDTKLVKSAKEQEQYEKEVLIRIVESNSNTIDELLAALLMKNLIDIYGHFHNDSSLGYGLGVNAAASLSVIYQTISPVKFFLIQETVKTSSYDKLDDRTKEMKKAVLIVDEIMQEISKLILCDDFVHGVVLHSELHPKFICLKSSSTTIPNPHQIPSVYSEILNDTKEIYRAYTNFVQYFTGNFEVAIRRLGKIKKSFNELYNLCPTIRIKILEEIKSAIGLSDFEMLPTDIKHALMDIEPETELFFHAPYIEGKEKVFDRKISDYNIERYLKKLQEVLKSPLKDVVKLDIAMAMMIKCMFIMRNAPNLLSSQQKETLEKLEVFLQAMKEKRSVQAQEMVNIPSRIVQSAIKKRSSEQQMSF